jgi:hypothetical protein
MALASQFAEDRGVRLRPMSRGLGRGPISFLAQLWLLANCLAAGTVAGAIFGAMIADLLCVRGSWDTGLMVLGAGLGALGGTGLHTLLVRRLGGSVIDLFFLTAALVPVVGPFIGAAGAIHRVWRLRRKAPSSRATAQFEENLEGEDDEREEDV